ncbi:MAG: PA14 domain-containing protein [Anaerolineales bacterium]
MSKRFFAFVLPLALLTVVFSASVAAQDNYPLETEPCAVPAWTGEFYDNASFAGTPAYVLCRRMIEFNWGDGVPLQGINNDGFSSRWRSTQAFPTAGTYEFTVWGQGDVTLRVNGATLIQDNNATNDYAERRMQYEVARAGQTAEIVIEHVDHSGPSQLYLAWSLVAGGSPGATDDHNPGLTRDNSLFPAGGGNIWAITHFNNPNLTEPHTGESIHVADGISLDYAENPPRPGFNADGWSSRWVRTVDFPAGTYTFTVRADDSARLLVDGAEVVPLSANGTGSVTLTAGRHTIAVEHFDNSGPAHLFVTWDPPVGTMLFPDGCNGHYTAGLGGNAPLCPDRGIATFTPEQIAP